MRTWAEIDLSAIGENVRIINGILDGKSKIMAMVKADAYGHGAPFIARELELYGVDFFGVSSIDEALQLRGSGISKNILILGSTIPVEDNIEMLTYYGITQTVFDFDYAEIVSNIARKCRKKLKIHIKIDTGMNRLGFKYTSKNNENDTLERIKSIMEFEWLEPEGIYTHFDASDEIKSNYTNAQFALFLEIVSKLEKAGIYFEIKHAANSGATINFRETALNYVRCGLSLYGLYPSKATERIGLKPAMQLKTRISQLHMAKKGETVSYNRTYEAERDILAATLPIGYADGFARCLSNSASVLVNGKKAPVIGMICMDQSMIDVTNCGDVKENDIVTIFGEDNGEYISVDYLAGMMKTINYETICLIGKRVPRIFFKDGEETGQLNYIAKK